jgi:hypothetical protein
MWIHKTDDELSRERITPMWLYAVSRILLYALASLIRRGPCFPDWRDPRTVICNTCYRVKTADAEHACNCGGTFEDIRYWKWVDEANGKRGRPD